LMLVMLLWVYIHTGQAWKICLTTVGFEPTTFGTLAQACPVWIYTAQSNITSIIFTWVHYTTQKKLFKIVKVNQFIIPRRSLLCRGVGSIKRLGGHRLLGAL
jgi:hypothetical protein